MTKLTYDQREAVNNHIAWRIFKYSAFVAVLGIPLMLAGCPMYNVWERGMSGKAEFTKAEQNRKIRVQEAQAALDSAKLTAQAEVERAKGVAEANRIVADGLGGVDGYIKWRTIEMLENTRNQLVYVPTEAMLPITEAGRVGQ